MAAMRRKLVRITSVLFVLLLAGGIFVLWPRDRITVESWQNIQIGMTEEEVAEILGRPELGRRLFEFEGPTLEEPEIKLLDLERLRIWDGRRGRIEIELDHDRHVRRKRFQGVRWINGGVFDRLRDWLGL